MEHAKKGKEAMRNKGEIIVEMPINVPVEQLWEFYTGPEHIMEWNHASDDWHSPHAENDVRVNGEFDFRMEARDGSEGFDFKGYYTEVVPHERLAYVMEDGRRATVEFIPIGNSTHMKITFEPEQQNTMDLQKEGWQAILENFKKYAEEH